MGLIYTMRGDHDPTGIVRWDVADAPDFDASESGLDPGDISDIVVDKVTETGEGAIAGTGEAADVAAALTDMAGDAGLDLVICADGSRVMRAGDARVVTLLAATTLAAALSQIEALPDGSTCHIGGWARLTRENRERRLVVDLKLLDSLARLSTSLRYGSTMPVLSAAGLTWPASREHVAFDDLSGVRDEHLEVEGVWQLPSDDPPVVGTAAMTGSTTVSTTQPTAEGVEVVGGSPAEWRIGQRSSTLDTGNLFTLADDVSAAAIGALTETLSISHRQPSYTAGSAAYLGGAFVSGATAWRGTVLENANGPADPLGLIPIAVGEKGVILEKLRICWRVAS